MHRARLIRGLFPLALLLLGGCAVTPPRSAPTTAPATKVERPKESAAPSPDDPAVVAAAFTALNALRKQADKEKSSLGAWTIYQNARTTAAEPLRDFLTQTLAALEAELGRYDDAMRDYPAGRPITIGDTAAFPEPADYEAVPAVDAIAELARDRRLVFVNEVHHDASTRALTLALLPKLRALGYTHFAAESIDEKDTELSRRGYPLETSGYYLREPLYGDIVRRALALGFVVVPYESVAEGASSDERERDQARHLYERVFAATPDARLFVHAGYAHVHKAKGHLWGTEPLAMQLAAKLGVTPLCVDQSLLRPNREDSVYGAYPLLIDSYAPRQAIVMRSRHDRRLWSLEPSFYDVSVIAPPASEVDGRPAWLGLNGARQRTPIDANLCGATRPCLIEARYIAESAEAVPVDRWLRLRDEAMAPLYLFPGRYRLRASDAHGTLLGERDLDVSDAPTSDAP